MRKKQPILDVSGDDSSTLEPLAVCGINCFHVDPAEALFSCHQNNMDAMHLAE
jgi:hypothetical protein